MFKELLTAPTEEFGRWSRFAVFQVKLWAHCARLLKQNRCGQQAAALSYHTLFGIVPLAIVMLIVFQAIPAYRDVGSKAKQFFYEQLNLHTIIYPTQSETEEDIKLTEKIDEISEEYISNLNTGAITLFSCGIVIWAALGLLTTIERSFNNIWHVARGRNFLQRLVNYWAFLTLGPALLILAFYASTNYLVKDIDSSTYNKIRPLLMYLIGLVSLLLLYLFLPNTKVRFGAAVWGAAVAALIWTGAKYLFAIYVIKVVPQKAIYGVMGLIPLSVFWIYITWLIVLFGLQLTYATQHLKKLDQAEIASMRKSEDYFIVNDFTVIQILAFILSEFEQRKGPVDADTICQQLNFPADFGGKILDQLTNAGLLLQTAEPKAGYILAVDPDKLKLSNIAKIVDKISVAKNKAMTSEKFTSLMNEYFRRLEEYSLKQIISESVEQPQVQDKENQ